MTKLNESIQELRQRLLGAENQGEEILALITKLDRELKVRRIAKVGAQVHQKLKKAQERRWDLRDVRLLVKYNGEVDLIPPSEKSSLIFEIGLEMDGFV